jgi:small subunit ribosomal protein S6
MYELNLLINPLLEQTDAQATAEKFRQNIEKLNGQVKKLASLDKKKLAYPIKKQLSAYFVSLEFEMEPENVEKLQQELKLNNDILRFLLLVSEGANQLPPKPRTALRPKAVAAPASVGIKPEKAAKVKIEELDKKLEELLK